MEKQKGPWKYAPCNHYTNEMNRITSLPMITVDEKLFGTREINIETKKNDKRKDNV